MSTKPISNYGEVYWAGVWKLINYRAPLSDSMIAYGHRHLDHEERGLTRLLGLPHNRDGSPADSIIFHANKTLIAGFQNYDSDTISDALTTIYKRHAKLRIIQPHCFDRTAPSWFARQR